MFKVCLVWCCYLSTYIFKALYIQNIVLDELGQEIEKLKNPKTFYLVLTIFHQIKETVENTFHLRSWELLEIFPRRCSSNDTGVLKGKTHPGFLYKYLLSVVHKGEGVNICENNYPCNQGEYLRKQIPCNQDEYLINQIPFRFATWAA